MFHKKVDKNECDRHKQHTTLDHRKIARVYRVNKEFSYPGQAKIVSTMTDPSKYPAKLNAYNCYNRNKCIF